MSKSKLIGWVLSVLLVLFLILGSASGKFTEWEGKAAMFEKMGFTTDIMFKIGILEVIIAILFVIPITAFIGAILLTGYLGGATVTHIRVGDMNFFAVVMGVIMWVALGLRNPIIFRLAAGRCESTCPAHVTAADDPSAT